MASEELHQRYPKGIGQKIGQYELFECQLVTLNQFAQDGILPLSDYGKHSTQKCDALIISRIPDVHAVLVGEHKRPGEITPKNWLGIAKDLLETKCKPTNAVLGYVTDGITTHWINGQAEDVLEVEREDRTPLPAKVDYAEKVFQTELIYILANFDPVTNRIRAKAESNPDYLAREVWQTIWRLRADSPEDCLATFVELFVFKFLDDLKLLRTDANGADVSVAYVMSREKDKAYSYYWDTVRPYIKTLFPPGEDGYSIINGIVLQPTNRDHNIIFHEIMRKFVKFGSLKNTESDFKRRLYESFLQESKTTSTFGQFLTTRKVVSAVHDLAEVSTMPVGREICDPACGVGGFVLEQMARDLSAQWKLSGNRMQTVHNWHAWEIVSKTSILAKANALVHCGDCLADQPKRIPSFAKWLNQVFYCFDKTALGALEEMPKATFDLILTNPPFVVSGSKDYGKIIKNNDKRQVYYGQKSSGVEGLFIQLIVSALKVNGEAWVLLPETFFLRTTDADFRSWLFRVCAIDFLAILPERTFFNTPKRVVITHLKKRVHPLEENQAQGNLKKESTLLFAISEIGETRDAKRLPCESDLPEMVQCYKTHRSGHMTHIAAQRAVVVSSSELSNAASLNIRQFWKKSDAIALGLLGTEEDPVELKKAIARRIDGMKLIVDNWASGQGKKQPPPMPKLWKTVSLGDKTLFRLRIGKRVLKKQVYRLKTNIPLFSANIRKPFGCVHAPNAGNLKYGGALWSIDSDFDCRGVAPGEIYSITDHCGEIQMLNQNINPHYLATQVRQAGGDQGFNREYRPSLGIMAEVQIDLPITKNGEFDLALMCRWAEYQTELEHKEHEIEAIMQMK